MKFYELHEIAILANWQLDSMKKCNETFYNEHIKQVKHLRALCSRKPSDEEVLIDMMPF